MARQTSGNYHNQPLPAPTLSANVQWPCTKCLNTNRILNGSGASKIASFTGSILTPCKDLPMGIDSASRDVFAGPGCLYFLTIDPDPRVSEPTRASPHCKN